MEEPTIDERKRWWLLCYAITSMEKVVETCGLMSLACDSNRDAMFGSLATAIHTFYGRPFKRSNGVGRLPCDLVPLDSVKLHEWMLHFRDGAYSHLDADHSETAGRALNDVVYINSPGKKLITTCDPRVQVKTYKDVGDLAVTMHRIFMNEVLGFHGRFAHLMTDSDGKFLLSLDMNTSLFVPYTMPEVSVISYK